MKKISILIILPFIIFFSGCYTIIEADIEQPVSEKKSENVPKPQMARTIDSFSINSYPDDNGFIIAAISPRFQNHNDEVEFILKNASIQIATYWGAHIRYQKLIDENIIGTLQIQQIDVDYNKQLAISLIGKLKIIKESTGHDYFAALVSMNSGLLPDFPQIDLTTAGKPSWINTPPYFNGFITGVGISGRRKSVYDSWENADKQAMAEIANAINTTVQSGTATIERSSSSRGASTTVTKTHTISDLNIKGFYILSRWREPDFSNYYTLAIAKKPE